MPQINTEQYIQLKRILSKMFQLDQAELDFGIYRIMNQKRQEINDFLDNQLLKQIRDTLAQTGDASLEETKKELHLLESTLKGAGVDIETNAKVQELRDAVAKGGSVEAMELEVYSRMTEFFKRYYKEGDFISQRRYKDGVYAIPYEGEEVKLHWANHDQYYIKTGEHFKNYTFKVDGKTVHFVLKEASTEKDNNKAEKGKERRFKLLDPANYEGPIFEETESGELNIYFTYDPEDKKATQDKLNANAVKQLSQELPGEWTQLLLQSKPSAKNRNRTILEYRLNDYTAKNTFDYFIHKDLGTFLRRELDFYIKNEILHLDDIDLDNEQHFQKQLILIKAFKKVTHKIIDFLAQLEDFQKKLWLKKKMVLQSDYCITLDRIGEAFYDEIANNKAQIEEWKELFLIEELDDYSEPLSLDFLKNNPFLLLDTKFFSHEFKYKLLASFDNIDEQCDGLLINSENFQALNLLQERYKEQVNCVYIDPPYNTASSEIIYKNSYKHSSWLSMLNDRIDISSKLMQFENSFIHIAIDQEELSRLINLANNIFNEQNFIGLVTVVHKPEGRNQEKFIATSSEYLLIYSKNKQSASFEQTILDPAKINDYKEIDEQGRYKLEDYIRFGGGDDNLRINKPHFFYPIYVHPETLDISLEQKEYYEVILPITASGQERTWQTKIETFEDRLNRSEILSKWDSGVLKVMLKYRPNQLYKSHWDDKRYNAIRNGTNILDNIFGGRLFSFPKSVELVKDSIKISSKKEDVILDYFSGSGTTAHSVIKLNREDTGKRKYIMVEMGEYFNSVTKPRVQKVVYSDEWKDGKPTTRKGSSHMFKYMRLESYEDTLNNLVLQKTDMDAAMHEGYILRYSLEVESRDSLLMLEAFQSPFGYTIQITENNELKETKVDLVETFNYLIGLQVKTMEIIRGYVVVTGMTLDEKKVLVIWRDLEKHSNEDLNEFFSRLRYNPLDGEFAQIYVNGDNNIENLKIGDERWKVTLIEHEFHKRMWDIAAE